MCPTNSFRANNMWNSSLLLLSGNRSRKSVTGGSSPFRTRLQYSQATSTTQLSTWYSDDGSGAAGDILLSLTLDIIFAIKTSFFLLLLSLREKLFRIVEHLVNDKPQKII